MAISKIILNSNTQIDLTDTTAVASDVASGKYFYGADGVKTIGTASSDSDYFVVTMSEDQNGSWNPDCTFAEIQAAYTAGKEIIVISDPSGTRAEASGYYNASYGGDTFYISVNVSESEWDEQYNEYIVIKSNIYTYTSNSYTEIWSGNSYDTENGTATASDVANGKLFWSNGGRMVGTASGQTINNQNKTVNPSTSQQTVTADAGYTGLGTVTVAAMPSGTAGTPTATKGTVSNNSVSITPSVTNTTGYITGSTINGTAVTVSASELDSGTKSISANGTGIDVVGYAAVDVEVANSGPENAYECQLTQDNQGNWYPIGKTYAELATIYAEVPIDFYINNESYAVTKATKDSSGFHYTVLEVTEEDTAYVLAVLNYSFSASGVTEDDRYVYYDTFDADAVASNVTSGKVFYTSTGRVVGTATGPLFQEKTNITPTTSSQTITADSGYDALSSVQINAMPSGSATTPATTITANPSISVNASGLITATASASQNITPTVSAGYVSSGTAGTVTVSGSKTQQLTTKAATTYNTSVTDQTIASGTYLTGTQTIKAVQVSGLDASKIASGTTVTVGDANDPDRIASVTGTLSFSTITTSSSSPSGGSNGDIWIKTS